jgi:translation initiation factor IF-2
VAPVVGREATVQLPTTAKELSSQIGVKVNQIIALLMRHNIMANINAPLSADVVQIVGKEFGVTVNIKEGATLEQQLEAEVERGEDRPEDLQPRAPIVTFMGHVDHGKTSLLDRIRNTNVAAGEAGGITQHIGAYRANIGGRYVTFLDTPGHEAFTAMRARGANVTDVVVLVVAADDGVMPQTEEALDHARAAGVPIVVAVNKMDKPEAKPDKVRTQLAEKGLMPEEWGGDSLFVNVSALTGAGVEELLEMLALVAELEELKANPKKKARGTALEARVSKSRGIAVTLLVREGTLQKGDVVLCGSSYGRVKAICDDRGSPVREAGPSMPVEVLGLSEAPEAGEGFVVVDSPQRAREIAEARRAKVREAGLLQPRHVSLESLYTDIEAGKAKELCLIVKADVKGSLEAQEGVLDKLPKTEVKLRVLRSGVGNVMVSDVLLADASDAVIIGLHVGVEAEARRLAERRGVQVRLYDVIYHVTEDIRKALEGLLEPEKREKITGHAQVRQVFKISRMGAVAGCYVTEGSIPRSASVRILRDQGVAHVGPIESLKRFKDDVREVREGFECGIRLSGYDDIKEGDVFEAFVVEEIAPTLESRSGRDAGAPTA